jgi:hypothetical protein
MNHQWPPEVTRAMHEYSDAAPVAPSLASVFRHEPIATSSAPYNARPDPEERPVDIKEITVSVNVTSPNSNRRWLAMAAAVIVVIGVAGIALAINTDDDESPSPAPAATVVPATIAASDPISGAVVSGADGAATAAFEAVSGAYDLYNLGNMEEWTEVRDSGSVWPSEPQRTVGIVEWRADAQREYDAGGRYVATECVSKGLGDWPDIADEGVATGYYFTCESVWKKRYEDPETPVLYETFNWVVNDGVVVAVNSAQRSSPTTPATASPEK